MSDSRSGSSAGAGTPAHAAAASPWLVRFPRTRDDGPGCATSGVNGSIRPSNRRSCRGRRLLIVFAGLRILTHWIRGGHGPSGGGISLGGRHFHHYNIGIALLAAVGMVGLRGSEKQRRHPVVAIAYGSAAALVVDELALLLDLEDVYWASDGRKSVDAALGVIAAGATFFAGLPLWPHAHRALRSRR